MSDDRVEQQRQARMKAWAQIAASTAQRHVEREQAKPEAQGYAVGANGDNGNGGNGTAPKAEAKPAEKKEEGSTMGRSIMIGLIVAVGGGFAWEMIRRLIFEEEQAAAETVVAQHQLGPGYGGYPPMPMPMPVPMPYPMPQYPTQPFPAAAADPSSDTVKIEVPRKQYNDSEFWKRLAGGAPALREDYIDVEYDED